MQEILPTPPPPNVSSVAAALVRCDVVAGVVLSVAGFVADAAFVNVAVFLLRVDVVVILLLLLICCCCCCCCFVARCALCGMRRAKSEVLFFPNNKKKQAQQR